MRVYIIAFLSLTVACIDTYASRVTTERGYIIRNWDTEEGLPVSTVTALAKTPDGYLWIGTSGGLVKFDGVRFQTYYPANTPALTDGNISALFADSKGALWIGTHSGSLLRYAANRIRTVSLGENLQRAAATSFTEDQSGRIWATMERAGVLSYYNGRTAYYGTESGLYSDMVWSITEDRQGGLWVISRWHLMRFDGKAWCYAEGLPNDFPRVAAIAPSRDGGLWIACVAQTGPPTGDRGARIFRYRDGRVTEDPLAVPWSQDSRRSIPRVFLEDSQGKVWCTTRGAGIFFRDESRWQLFSEAASLSQLQTIDALEDEDGAIWLAVDGAGLFQLRPGVIVTFEPPVGTLPSCFWTVCAGRDGSIWGGTDGNGIFRWKSGTMIRYRSDQGLSNEHVNALIEDQVQDIWAGTMGGLFLLKDNRFEPVKGIETLELPVFSLKEDRTGRIWAGTRNGLVQFGDGVTNIFGKEQGIPFGPINAIEEDRNGRIWVSIPPFRDGKAPGPVGPYGLFAQTGDGFEHIAEGRWGGEPNIRSLQADGEGNLWVGTISTGFYRLRDGMFTEYSRDDGLPNDRIQAVVSDKTGNLWFCSELGVFGSPIQQLLSRSEEQTTRLNWWRLQRTDGLPNRSATGNGQPSAMRGYDGRIWFANGNAITGFDPELVTRSARLKPPVIEEVFVDGARQPLESLSRLRVTSESRRIEIHYTSPNTSSPDLPTLWTQLKGFDSDWVNGGNTRVASYNLQPGNYKFAVAVTGPDGSRIETESPLQIEVVPHFWERQSVRFLAGILFVAGLALGVWRWEKARLQRRLRQLEIQRARDEVRQRIARDIHDDLGSGLTEITLLSDNLRMEIDDRQTSVKTVERIAARARALTHEMDEVVWAVNPRTDTLESLVTYLNDFAQERLKLAGIRCRLNTAPELPNIELPADIRHSLYRAAKEALNNAIKHSGPTEVVITIEPQDGQVQFVIQDNGRGFDPDQNGKRGNGLHIMRQRLEEIGGSCVVQSKIGLGTSVCFTIPITGNQLRRFTTNGYHVSQ